MKTILLLIGLAIAFFSHSVYGQTTSDLYLHVDSLLIHQLKYDKAIKKEEIKKAVAGTNSDTTNVRIVGVSTIDKGVLVILNQKPIELDELNKYQMKDIKFINFIQPSDTTIFLYVLYPLLVFFTNNNSSLDKQKD